MAVKMRPTDSRTKRPCAALLLLDTEICIVTVENRRDLEPYLYWFRGQWNTSLFFMYFLPKVFANNTGNTVWKVV